jgi:trk system potassium uptake protein
MKFQPIIRALGFLLILTGAAMFPCALVDVFLDEENWAIFALTGLAVAGFGGLLVITAGSEMQRTGTREAFLLTVLVWLILPFAAAFPFIAMGFSLTDSYFETVSGLTTTGATIMTGLDQEQRGLLLWRSILQWIGGVGIIVMALAILPTLRVGGMHLFKTESSDVSGKFLPNVTEIAKNIATVYIILTMACGVCYAAAGMPAFDAVNHALTTLSAGGYSTSDLSLGKYSDTPVIWVSCIFMTLAVWPFYNFVMIMLGRPGIILRDPQPRLFLAIVFFVTLILLIYFRLDTSEALEMRSSPTQVRDTVFSVISVLTGTGYGLVDFSAWGSFSQILFLFIMLLGGCTGSAAGGLKMFRVELVVRIAHGFIRRMLSPNRITIIRYAGKPVKNEVLQSVMIFAFLYLFTFSASALLLSLAGMDTLTAYSAAATSLANVGPGLGVEIGPASTFQSVPDFVKWVMIINMILGRLELITIFVVLSPRFWRT